MTYYVTGTTNLGCQVEDSIFIDRPNLPYLEYNNGVSWSDPNQPLCFGTQVTVQSNSASLNTGWFGQGWNNGIQDGTPFYPDTSLTYVLSAYHPGSGCYDSIGSGGYLN